MCFWKKMYGMCVLFVGLASIFKVFKESATQALNSSDVLNTVGTLRTVLVYATAPP